MNAHDKLVLNRIRQQLHEKNPNAKVILFGSKARGESGDESDWDVLILLNKKVVDKVTEKEYRKEMFNVELDLGEPISTLVYSKHDWETRHKATPLYKNIAKDGIVLQ
jgi:uncharacterized protein